MLVKWAVESDRRVLGGLLVMFPVLTILSYGFAIKSSGLVVARQLVPGSLLGLAALALALIVFRHVSISENFVKSVAMPVGVWLVVATVGLALLSRWN